VTTPFIANRPNPRTVSNTVGKRKTNELQLRSMINIAWGQLLAHDLSFGILGNETLNVIPP
jgi:hypothetical protein